MMKVGRRIGLFLAAALILSGCSNSAAEIGSSAAQTEAETSQAETERAGETAVTSLPQIDSTKWQYNSDDKIYWQTGISYCENPADENYETLGIFIPAAYMNAKDNGDGTFTCEINNQAAVQGYTADSAPIVIPVNTPGYSAMEAPTDYVTDSVSYTSAGFIYVAAGCRGRDAGAPAGVTDLKAAIRYIRYNDGVIPGDVDRIFSFGMSGGGAQSALLGATGDSEDYEPYLTAIGAVSGVSDAVTSSMCWCPITELDYADEAYEWNLGSTRTDLTEQEQTLSNGMAEAFAQYINDLGLKDSSGNVLTLTESEEGIYQSGTYYEYLKGVVETSLNNFLEDTTFPYKVETKKVRGAAENDRTARNRTERRREKIVVRSRMEHRRTETECLMICRKTVRRMDDWTENKLREHRMKIKPEMIRQRQGQKKIAKHRKRKHRQTRMRTEIQLRIKETALLISTPWTE